MTESILGLQECGVHDDAMISVTMVRDDAMISVTMERDDAMISVTMERVQYGRICIRPDIGLIGRQTSCNEMSMRVQSTPVLESSQV